MRFLLLGAAVLVFASCDSNRYFEAYNPIEGREWAINKPSSFTVAIDDTVNVFNFYFNIRHTEQYKYQNIFVFLDTEFPNGTVYRDTLECMMADASGKWYGSGSGDLKDHSFLFKRNVAFEAAGAYTFTFHQGMREDPLPAISDIGLRIEYID